MPFAIAAAGIGLVGTMIATDSAEDQQQASLDAQGNSAAASNKLGQDQLAFNIRQYEEQKPMRDAVAAQQLEVSKAQQKAMETQTGIAADYDTYNKETFRPLEKQMVADAQGYDTAGRRLQATEAASADVTAAFDKAAQGMNASLGRAGIAPGSGRSMALMNDTALAKATATAGATQAATNRVEDIGHARMMDAVSLGRGLPGNQSTTAALGINAGSAAAASGAAAVNAAAAGIPGVNNGYAGALAGAGQAGSLYGQAARGYGGMADAGAGALGAFGKAVGAFGTTPYGQSMADSVSNTFNGYQVGTPGGAYVGQDAGYDSGGYDMFAPLYQP
jgi:hypothetical protein